MDQRGVTATPESALRAIGRDARSSDARGASCLEQALFCIGRITLSQAALEELSALLSRLDETSWRHLLALAQIHGVAPLAFSHLAKSGLLTAVPAPIAAAFKDAYLQTLVNNRRMQTVFREVVGALSAAGIGVMPLKGLALASRYYGDIALRPMTDMDLLVRQQDVPQATSVLRRLGYSAADGMGSPHGFYSLTSAVVVYARSQSLSVEMHWELFGRYAYRPSLPASAVWKRALEISVFDQSVRYLHPRDEIWYLSVHAAIEHRLERLIWLVDIAELVDSLPADWDWDQFAQETVAAGLALPVATALGYCCAHLRLALPAGALERLRTAADTPEERATCVAAQSDLMSATWIQMTATSVRGPKEATIFLRGVLAPHLATLEVLYGRDAMRWRALPYMYLRHWRRTAAPTLRALSTRAARQQPHAARQTGKS